MEFFEVILKRHSVRKFLPKPVEEAKILKIFEAVRLAPSWRNRQCWEFIVVRDKATINTLAKFRPHRYNINIFLKDAPVIIVALADPKKSGRIGDQSYYLVDVGIALEHLVLAATDLGLGTCWLGAFDERLIKKSLGIPEKIRVVALTPLGYPQTKPGILDKAIKTFARSKYRKTLTEFVFFEKYGEANKPNDNKQHE